MTDMEIARINELAKKKKTQGLTEEEAKEQLELRTRFIEDFRASFKAQLDNIELVDPGDPRFKKRNN